MTTPEVHRATAEALLSASATHHLTSAQRLATLAEAQVHATLALSAQPAVEAPAPFPTIQQLLAEYDSVAASPLDPDDDPAEPLVKAPRTRRPSAGKAAGK